MVHGRFWLVNVICLLNCDNERDLCQLLDAAFAVSSVWSVSSDAGCTELRRRAFTYWDYAFQKRIETRAQSRSVMLLNVLGCTRNTLTSTASFLPCNLARRGWENFEPKSCWGLMLEIILHERGMSCRRVSSERTEYVPGSCTHRPSLPVMGCE